MGVLGVVSVYSLCCSAVGIGFMWDPLMPGWTRHGLPGLSNLAGPISTFSLLLSMLGVVRSLLAFAPARVFVVAPLWILWCPQQLLNSSHVRERDKVPLRSIMVGGVWHGFLPREGSK